MNEYWGQLAVVVTAAFMLAAMGIFLFIKWATGSPGTSITAQVFGVLVAIIVGAAALLNQLPKLVRRGNSRKPPASRRTSQ